MSLCSILSFQAIKLHHHRHIGARPCYLYRSSLEHNSNYVFNLHRAFHIMLVVLKGNLNSKLAALSVIPTTYCFIIPLLDVVAKWLHLHEISRQMCRDHHQHSELLEGNNWMHVEKYHPFPSMIVLSSTPVLLSLQHKRVHVLCCPLSSFLFSLCYLLPWSVTIFYVNNFVSIIAPLKNSWYSNTSRNHYSFLGPVLFQTGIPTSELWCVIPILLATWLPSG